MRGHFRNTLSPSTDCAYKLCDVSWGCATCKSRFTLSRADAR